MCRAPRVRNEGPPVSSHAPNRREQLSHRRDNGDLAGFARGPKPLIVLTLPRVAADGIDNHHTERLAQASVSEWNCWTVGEALLARSPQPRRNADIAAIAPALRK